MSDKGNTEFIASVTSLVREQQKTVQSLVSSIESAMSDMVQALERTDAADRIRGVETLMGAIESGLADIADGVSSKLDLSPLIKAIAEIRPTITVQAAAAPQVSVTVEPTPITIEAAMPAAQIFVVPNHSRARITFNTGRYGQIESAELVWEQTAKP